jgi:hypothetical protein
VRAPKNFQVKKKLLDQIHSYILTEKLSEGPMSSRRNKSKDPTQNQKEQTILNTKESSI